jgi:hypothetical protein
MSNSGKPTSELAGPTENRLTMIRIIGLLFVVLGVLAVRYFTSEALSTSKTPWATLRRAIGWAAVVSVLTVIPPQCTRNEMDLEPDYRPLGTRLKTALWFLGILEVGVLWGAWSQRKVFPDPDAGMVSRQSETQSDELNEDADR